MSLNPTLKARKKTRGRRHHRPRRVSQSAGGGSSGVGDCKCSNEGGVNSASDRRRRGAGSYSTGSSSSASYSSPSSSSKSSKSSKSSSSSKENDEAHEGVEALLEAYYMHIDFSHKRLSELRDAIEDTEDMAEIYLDSQRNQLIKIDLLISNGMLSVGIFSMISGSFGMNLRSGLESEPQVFKEVCLISASVCAVLFLAVTLYLRSKKLLQM